MRHAPTQPQPALRTYRNELDGVRQVRVGVAMRRRVWATEILLWLGVDEREGRGAKLFEEDGVGIRALRLRLGGCGLGSDFRLG